MPDIPADAIPLSSLSDSAQAFFRCTQRPLLPAKRPTKTPEVETVPAVSGKQLVPDNLLGDFARWRHQVSECLVPTAGECRLAIVQSTSGNGSDGGKQRPETCGVQISLPDRYGALVSGTIPVDPSLLKEESNPIPSKPGSHPVSDEFREYLLSYISWMMFHHARSLWPAFALEADALRAVFPARPSNAYEVFVPDYKDTRFPCLARMPCGDQELPVILLGQAHGNYICRPLPHAPIREQALPPVLKGKDKLVQEGQLVYGNSNAPLMAPVSLLDFPEHWYTGSRSPAEFHVGAMASTMEFNASRRKEQKSPGTPKPQPALTTNPFIKVSVTLLIGVSLFALLKSF